MTDSLRQDAAHYAFWLRATVDDFDKPGRTDQLVELGALQRRAIRAAVEHFESLSIAPHRSPEDDGVCVICGWPAIVDPAINAVHRRADGRALCWTCDEESPFPAVSQDSEMPEWIAERIVQSRTTAAANNDGHVEFMGNALVWLADALAEKERLVTLSLENQATFKHQRNSFALRISELERELEQSRKQFDLVLANSMEWQRLYESTFSCESE